MSRGGLIGPEAGLSPPPPATGRVPLPGFWRYKISRFRTSGGSDFVPGGGHTSTRYNPASAGLGAAQRPPPPPSAPRRAPGDIT